MRELTAVMSLLLAIATSLAVFAAARPASSERPASHPTASAVAR
jgi:hypothetical protein